MWPQCGAGGNSHGFRSGKALIDRGVLVPAGLRGGPAPWRWRNTVASGSGEADIFGEFSGFGVLTAIGVEDYITPDTARRPPSAR
jgi:hypothetical protein